MIGNPYTQGKHTLNKETGCVESVEATRKQESTETEEDVKDYVRDVSRHAHTQPHNVNTLEH
jgi:hypothetical protein